MTGHPPTTPGLHFLVSMNKKSKMETTLQTSVSVILKPYKTPLHQYILIPLHIQAYKMLSILMFKEHMNIYLPATNINPQNQLYHPL